LLVGLGGEKLLHEGEEGGFVFADEFFAETLVDFEPEPLDGPVDDGAALEL
jgi:hypothetical protein